MADLATRDKWNKAAASMDLMIDNDINLVVNTVGSKTARRDSYALLRTALTQNVPYCTTLQGAFATVQGIEALRQRTPEVCSLQEYHGRMQGSNR